MPAEEPAPNALYTILEQIGEMRGELRGVGINVELIREDLARHDQQIRGLQQTRATQQGEKAARGKIIARLQLIVPPVLTFVLGHLVTRWIH